MKATNNNTNTLFMEIFAELLVIAKAYFQELFKNEKPGVYTLKDIYSYIANCESLETKQGKAERLTERGKDQAIKYYAKSPYYSNIDPILKNSVLYLCKVSNNIVSIEKGNFKCSFDVIKIFEYLERFKQLSGAKEKLEFVKEDTGTNEQNENNCLCAFDITFDKKDKTFLIAKTKNFVHYIDNNVLIDINLNKIYATDRFICKRRNVRISNLFGSWDKHVCISFDVFKKLVGKDCRIMVDLNEKEEQVIVAIKTANGEAFECRYNDFNKNISIEEVCPILYKELKLTVKDGKQFVKDLKVISKTSKFVSFEIEKGSDRLRVNYITEFGVDRENKYGEFHVQLSEPSNFTYRTDNKINRIISCLNDWNGEIYITKESYCNKISFVSDSCDNCFMVDGGKMNCFDQIRNKVDYFPNQLTPVYCEKETKEPGMYEPKEGETIEFTTTSYQVKPVQAIVQYNDSLGHFVSVNGYEILVKRLINIKPVGALENQNDTNLQESKESALNTIGISKNEWEKIELSLKDTYSITYEDGIMSFVPKDSSSFISKIYIWTYTERLGIYSKVGVSTEKDINTNIPFVEFLEQSLVDLKRHATNKVFFFMEKDGYRWEQPNAQTFHLFKNGKEKTFKNEFEAYNFVQNKENERYFDFNVSDYTDDMIEMVRLDLESIIFKVKQDSPKELKVIQEIKLYDKTGKIVFTYNDGSVDIVMKTTFNGYSVLQSVLQKINESL